MGRKRLWLKMGKTCSLTPLFLPMEDQKQGALYYSSIGQEAEGFICGSQGLSCISDQIGAPLTLKGLF